jgi:formylglycine-generating enzyme required for sulfatase activity
MAVAPVTPTAAPAERRVALVIGNAAYQYTTSLKNPVNDAQDMARVLQDLQFEVMLKTNATLETMRDAVFTFGERLKGGGVGVLYYSGHGMQVKGENYLIPVDANMVREDDIKYKTLNARDIVEKMDEAKTHLNLVFLDACRNNPFPRSVRAVSRGLASMNAPTGTLLVLATNPDNVAQDGTGRNGTYTKHLLRYITQPGLEVGMLLRRVRTAVREETGGQQVPWENGSIEGEFYFNGMSGMPPATPLASSPPTSSPSGGTQVAVGVYPQAPAAPKTQRNSLGMEFVLIPAGTFQMGANDSDAYNDEQPVHTVRLTQLFYLGKYEVTQGQWQAVMGGNPSEFKGDPNRPVENVSWDDVQEFIRRLNSREGGVAYRLPTDAEWEYAARAGTTTRWSFGDDASQLGRYAWYGGNAGGHTHPVGQLPPNPWGLYDMHGNVNEWVQDGKRDYTSGTAVDPAGPSSGSGRVNRGGSWGDGARFCRSPYRGSNMYGYGRADQGFRLLRVSQ